MLRCPRIAFAVIVLITTSAAADVVTRPVGPSGVVVNKQSGVAVATSPTLQGAGQLSPALPPTVKAIFSNLAKKYKKGLYMCCTGFQISGPGSAPHQHWLAASFKPSTMFTVSTIEVPISFSSGTNKFVITLNKDAGGIPGAQLATFTVTAVANFPTCCSLATVNPSGITVTAGQPYWVTVQTSGTGTTAVGVWNSNDTDQIDTQSAAGNDGAGWGTSSLKPGLAFAVFGS